MPGINKKNFANFPESRNSMLLLAGIWLLVQAYLIKSNGINSGGESIKVIREAENLSAGTGLSAPGYYFYFTEIILVFFKIKTGVGYIVVVAVQLALNLIALLYFYRFLVSFYRSAIIAFAGALLLLICFPYQLYNSFLYTESVFFSLSIIFSCYLLRQETFSSKKIINILLLLLLLCITRPTGIFFAAATFVYLLIFAARSMKPFAKIFIFIAVSGAGIFLLNLIIGGGGTLDMMAPFREEMVICDVPRANGSVHQIDSGNSLAGLFYYVTHHFHQFLTLAFLKTKSFFGLTRSWYSRGHNIFVASFFYSLYLLIILSLFARKLPRAFLFIAVLTMAFWFSVLLSCDEWHSRLFLTLTPFLIMAALYFFKGKQLPENSELAGAVD